MMRLSYDRFSREEGNNDKALDYLIDSKYADRRSWDNALERLGLQSVGGVLKPIALTAESEGERTQRTIGTPGPPSTRNCGAGNLGDASTAENGTGNTPESPSTKKGGT
ncbi:hypothetical protein V490_00193 [Pseudogymnoascus sp. VKM F-3557]|nr:hypothetical protein V490_00193 [Pseudogymnoascus sp. VKM F-3557]